MNPNPRFLAPVAGVLLACGFCWGQSVLVVDPSGAVGTAFKDLQPAINAASNGDIILVKGGFYTSFAIDGKALVLTADANATVFVGSGTISNTQSWQSVVVRGFMQDSPLVAHDAAGPLWIEDWHSFPGYGNASPAIQLTNCASVVIRGTVASGGSSIVLFSVPGGAGLDANNSSVAAYDSTFTGGAGSGQGFGGFAGGQGATLTGGSLFAARCKFTGGNGGNGTYAGNPSGPGAPGGAGLSTSATTAAETSNCQFIGGGGGLGPGGVGPNGAPLSAAGSYLSHTGPDFVYSMDSPVREQQSLALHFNCGIAADVYLFVASDPAPSALIPGIYGPLLIDLATLGYAGFGTLPPGPTTISIPIADMPPTLQGAVLATQAIFVDPNFTFIEVGAPSLLTVLDASL